MDGQIAQVKIWKKYGKILRFLGKIKGNDPKTPSNSQSTEEKQPEKKCPQIELQPEIFADIIPFIEFTKLANGLALANHQLHSLCAPKIYEDNRRFVNMLAIEHKDSEDEDCDDAGGTDNENVKKDNKKEKKRQVKVRKSQWDSEFSELVEIPIAEVPPPPNILGFRKIYILWVQIEI